MAASEGSKWTEQRKFMVRALSDLGLGKKDTMGDIIVQEVQTLAENIQAMCHKPIQINVGLT